MILVAIFIIGSVAYATVTAFAVRAAYTYGHRGDHTMPVTIAFFIIVLAVWSASLWLLLTMRLPELLR